MPVPVLVKPPMTLWVLVANAPLMVVVPGPVTVTPPVPVVPMMVLGPMTSVGRVAPVGGALLTRFSEPVFEKSRLPDGLLARLMVATAPPEALPRVMSVTPLSIGEVEIRL